MTTNNLQGKSFGRWEVLKFDTNTPKYKMARWWCKCSCGKIKSIRADTLYGNISKSCGCLKRELVGNRSRVLFSRNKSVCWKGYGEISANFFASIRNGAKYRKIDFNITIEELWELFLKQNRKCALSGLLLKFKTSNSICDGTASLDRIDSSKTYSIDNVQWIHKDINFMKQEFSQQQFFNYCKEIVAHNNL